jgi:hypothetical protein
LGGYRLNNPCRANEWLVVAVYRPSELPLRVKGEFVIESAVPADPAALYDHYRCHRDIQDLIAWLRSKGVTSKTPLHSLRKEYGSQINARYGLTAAQEMLRHADIG